MWPRVSASRRRVFAARDAETGQTTVCVWLTAHMGGGLRATMRATPNEGQSTNAKDSGHVGSAARICRKCAGSAPGDERAVHEVGPGCEIDERPLARA